MEIKLVLEGQTSTKDYMVVTEEPISLAGAMELAGVVLHQPCGGQGKCMRCGIRFAYGAPNIQNWDENIFDYKELKAGWRLGCKCTISRDCEIHLPTILVGDVVAPEVVVADVQIPDDAVLGIAVDIGTTTLAAALVDISTGTVLKTASIANSQVRYGADIMTRIQNALGGQAAEMTGVIREDVLQLALMLCKDLGQIKCASVSGNTTMIHFLLGFPVNGMAQYPFRAYALGCEPYMQGNTQVHFMPCASAFIGGDVVAGLYRWGLCNSPVPAILLDLGTNAEIALWDGRRLFATAAAAGPAFEGGNISCGIPSIAGAINHIEIRDGQCYFKTIDDAPPIGICGSGIIDAVYEMRRAGIIDEGGLLVSQYAMAGFPVTEDIVITAEDVQQVLLAKSAIRSGIEVLCEEAGVATENVGRLCVAGGLGTSISPGAVCGIGMVPAELLDRFEAVGNSSLDGAIRLLADSVRETPGIIARRINVIELGNHNKFSDLFMNNLYLD